MRRGGRGSSINSLGFRDYSRIRNDLYLHRPKIAGFLRRGPLHKGYIEERLLKKSKTKGAVGRGCGVAGVQAFSYGVLMGRILRTSLSVFTA